MTPSDKLSIEDVIWLIEECYQPMYLKECHEVYTFEEHQEHAKKAQAYNRVVRAVAEHVKRRLEMA